ncbi:NUDIX hydrolase [Rothia nasisuis]|uniref:NUDIX hydrolase n=2 Tax=Rothia nasisuis TaxID=2109647 RepID=UPI001F226C78|nr:NUDIX hydrolase [Rothia nasisuis]
MPTPRSFHMPHTETFYAAHTHDGALSLARGHHNRAEVNAAGAIIWRRHHDQVQVLIIHRPRYDDWSWPKGKQDSGETLPETAVREIREEVGLTVILGAPLAVTAYEVKGKTKEVYYWAAEAPVGQKAAADEGEVDKLRWVSPKQARAMLTNSTDKEPLDALLRLEKEQNLRTRPVIVVRHAKAKPRASWAGAEGERSLAATGKRQALAVGRLLEAWAPERIISSPWVRCMQTVYPYSKAFGVSIKEKRALTEAHHARSPKQTRKVVESLFEKRDKSVVLCTHRPVLPTVLEVFGGQLGKRLRPHLPTSDPYLKPGEMWVLQVSVAHPKTVISLEQIKPFDD